MSPDSRQKLRPPVLCRVPARQPPAQPSETTAVNYYTGHISMLSPNHQNPNQYGGHTALRGGGSSVQEHVAITSEDDFGDISSELQRTGNTSTECGVQHVQSDRAAAAAQVPVVQ